MMMMMIALTRRFSLFRRQRKRTEWMDVDIVQGDD